MTEISLGVGPVNLKLDLSKSWWGKLKRIFIGPKPNEATFIFLDYSYLRINNPEDGELKVFLSVVNASKKDIFIENVIFNHWQCNNALMPNVVFKPHGIGMVIEKYKYGNIVIDMTLHKQAILQLTNNIKPAINKYSSPEIPIKINCQLIIRESREAIGFSINSPNPLSYYYENINGAT